MGYFKFKGYSLAYFDTNVYIVLVQNPQSWKTIRTFLMDNESVLALSDVNVLELSDSLESRQDLCQFLLQLPSVILKPSQQIIEDEINSCLNGTEVNPVCAPITPLIFESEDPIKDLDSLVFRTEVVTKLRAQMIKWKPEFETRIHTTLENFGPIVESDRYTEADAPYYAFQLILLQILCKDSPAYAEQVLQEMKNPSRTPFHMLSRLTGLWTSTLAQYYRYYLFGRTPSGNDYGDLIQVIPIPYCRYAIVENALHDELNRLKRTEAVLSDTEVRSFKFLRKITGLPLRG